MALEKSCNSNLAGKSFLEFQFYIYIKSGFARQQKELRRPPLQITETAFTFFQKIFRFWRESASLILIQIGRNDIPPVSTFHFFTAKRFNISI